MAPGQMVLTRMTGAHSMAIDFENAITPALDAA
jgi:hypothetical protein